MIGVGQTNSPGDIRTLPNHVLITVVYGILNTCPIVMFSRWHFKADNPLFKLIDFLHGGSFLCAVSQSLNLE